VLEVKKSKMYKIIKFAGRFKISNFFKILKIRKIRIIELCL